MALRKRLTRVRIDDSPFCFGAVHRPYRVAMRRYSQTRFMRYYACPWPGCGQTTKKKRTPVYIEVDHTGRVIGPCGNYEHD